MRLAVLVATASSLLTGVAHAQQLTQPTGSRAVLGPAVAAFDQISDTPCSAPKDDAPDRLRLEASWQNGLHFDSGDDQCHLHVGGSAQLDSTWLIGPQSLFVLPGNASNGVGNSAATELRRVRLQIDGDLYGMFDYVVAYDFANANDENSGIQPPSFGNVTSAPAPQDIWLQVRQVLYVGNVRIGYQTKPIGLSNNTSSTNLPFMERPDVSDAFYAPFDNGYAIGVSVNDWTQSERMTWQYGIYRPLTNVFGIGLNKYEGGGRLTALPWYEDEGNALLHLGLGALGGETVEGESRARARPVLRNAPGYAVPILVDTGDVTAGHQYTFGPEFALVLGSWTVQAEWAGQFLTGVANASDQPQGTLFFHGGYVEVLYFLTGEHQEYQLHEGTFGRVIPLNNYYLKKGDPYRACGAWQVGARFSYLDLDNNFIQGGRIYDWTLGLNWFLTPNMKIQFNYIAEHRDEPGVAEGWINGIGMRAGYDF